MPGEPPNPVISVLLVFHLRLELSEIRARAVRQMIRCFFQSQRICVKVCFDRVDLLAAVLWGGALLGSLKAKLIWKVISQPCHRQILCHPDMANVIESWNRLSHTGL